MFLTIPALLVGLSASTAAGSYLQLDVERRTSPQPVGQLERRATSPFNAQIAQNTANYQEYIISLSVGTPGQRVGVTLDTGSSQLWIPSSSLCRTKRCDFGSYNPNSSSTYQLAAAGGFNITYAAPGDSDAGDLVVDALTVGNAPSAISSQAFGLSYAGYDAHGVIGLGPGVPHSNPTVVDNLVQSGLINRRAYSLYLNSYTQQYGSVLFGGIDSTKYTGNLVALPLQPGLDGTVSNFYVTLSKVTFTDAVGTNTVLTPDDYAQSVLVDSGTSYTALSDDLLERISTGMGAVTINQQGILMVPCGYNRTNATINYTFGGRNGVTIKVPVAETVGTRYRNQCNFGFGSALIGQSVLGDTFLRSAYVVFDIDNKMLAMAQAVEGQVTASKVTVIPTGTSMPGVSSTASASGTQLPSTSATTSLSLVAASTNHNSIVAITPTFNLGAAATASISYTSTSRAPGSSSTTSANVAPAPARTGLAQVAVWGAGLVAGALVL